MELTLISFATMAEEGALRERLHELGYAVEAVPGQSWLSHITRMPLSPAALFLGSAHVPREQLLAALTVSARPVSIGIFHRDTAPWDREVLARCTEFVGWPCPRAELALRLERLSALVRNRRPSIDEQALLDEFATLNLIGSSPPFLAALAMIKKLARCDAPVLIQGETGTGKELAARAIHYLSSRRDQPFVPVNCGAIPDNLVENELYGHARGAFTDAREAQAGLVALADGGTLFLDEVDTLSEKAQVTLLRFLQRQEYKPLGSGSFKTTNVRIVAACNADMKQALEQGIFRQDLFFRLNIANLVMPSLRERGDDTVILAEHFLRQYRQRYSQPDKHLAPETLRWLLSQSWPGNVRELESYIHREFVLAEGNAVLSAPSPGENPERRRSASDRRRIFSLEEGFSRSKGRAIEEFEKRYLMTLMAESRGNVTLAAKRAGKERRALGKLLKKHCIDRAQYR